MDKFRFTSDNLLFTRVSYSLWWLRCWCHWILVLNLAFCAYSCPILVKLKFSRQISEKHANIKFHENPSSGSRAIPCKQTDGGRADRHDGANIRFSQSRNKPRQQYAA